MVLVLQLVSLTLHLSEDRLHFHTSPGHGVQLLGFHVKTRAVGLFLFITGVLPRLPVSRVKKLEAVLKNQSPSARCPGVSLLLGAASSAPSGRGSGVLISTSSSSVRASAVVSVSPGLF